MPKYQKRTILKLHRELWDWMYKNPSRDKREWPKWKHNGGPYEGNSIDCFLCDWVEQTSGMGCTSVHSDCLLDWSPTTNCLDHGSYFDKWLNSMTPKAKKKYAKLIRDLPLKK